MPWATGRLVLRDSPLSARSAANAGLTKADQAAAATLATFFKAVAACLKHFAGDAFLARADNAAAIVNLLAFARVAAEVKAADLLSKHQAAAGAALFGGTQRVTDFLQAAAYVAVVAATIDTEPAFAFRELQLAFGFSHRRRGHQ